MYVSAVRYIPTYMEETSAGSESRPIGKKFMRKRIKCNLLPYGILASAEKHVLVILCHSNILVNVSRVMRVRSILEKNSLVLKSYVHM